MNQPNQIKIFFFFLCFVLLLQTDLLYAQVSTLFTTDKELSSSLINCIYQDKRQYIWIATEDGLNKYDGMRFTVYKNHVQDTTTIKNNYVKSLFEDSQDRFWIGCINGLHLYDRIHDTFQEVRMYNKNNLITPHITSIIETKDSVIWMATSGQGIIRIHSDNESPQVFTSLNERLSSLHLSDVFQDSRGNVWISSENQGLNLFIPETNEVKVFKAPHHVGSSQISSIVEDKNGDIYVGTLTNGLYRFSYQNMSFKPIHDKNRAVLFVKDIFIDADNRLLIGTDGQGIKILNEKTNSLEDFHIPSSFLDFSSMKVHVIYQDTKRNLWIGLFQKGVFLSYETQNKFDYWGYKSFTRNMIGSGSVMALLKDKANNLWIGTDNDGIYQLKSDGSSRHFKPTGQKGELPNTILCMVEEDDNYLWLGSYLQGLVLFNKNTGACTYFDNHNNIHIDDNSAHNKIFALKKDKYQNLWIGTSGAGVYVFDIRTKQFVKHYSNKYIGEYHIQNDWINCLHLGKDDIVWVGSFGGCFTINMKNQSNSEYYLTHTNRILPGDVVYSIVEDLDNKLWIGTTEGVAHYDVVKNQSKKYTIADGLPSNVIRAIVIDQQGNIWFSTHSGISKLIAEKQKFVNYYAYDGLQGNEFSLGAFINTQDGQLIVGGTSGVTAFDPTEIVLEQLPLSLYMTNLYVMNEPVVAGKKSGKYNMIQSFIADVDTIHLSYLDNFVALEFSTFDFRINERVRYYYKLIGLNPSWIQTEPGVNRISFTNLNHGAYTLRVKAEIHNNFSEEKQVLLIVHPPWYLTWWAKTMYVLLVLLILFLIYRYILEKIHTQNELREQNHAAQISEAKLQFFINIAHEIRTPMSLIISPLEKLLTEKNTPDQQKLYVLIYRNAQRILRLINQLMDVRKIDKGSMSMKFQETDLVDFIEDIMQTFEYQASLDLINLQFNHDNNAYLNAWIDMNNFDKVLVNILSNAFKYTPKHGEIIVNLSAVKLGDSEESCKEMAEIQIIDSGPGIEEGERNKIFERFYQINKDNELNYGTGVGLHLAYSLMQLLHGDLLVRSRRDGKQGSEFVLYLPLGSAHLQTSEMEINSQLRAVPSYVGKSAIFTHQQQDATASKTVRPKTNYRIVIVEDEADIRNYLLEELRVTYKVTGFENGKAALSHILQEVPDLIISDIMMPETDGITLLKKIRSNINVHHIPIVLLTAKASDDDRGVGFEAGADAYIAKPFNIELLQKIIAGILENRERLKPTIADNLSNQQLIEPIVLRSSDQILYEKIIHVINEHLSDPELNVEVLANHVGMSRVHMHRKLKELTNQSARDFIKTIRMKQAANLVVNKKLTVSEIAYAVGYNNLSHFSKTFKDFYGVSPTEFADANQQRDD